MGIPGLCIFIAIIASAFEALRRVNRSWPIDRAADDRPRALTQALTAALIGFVVGAYFLSLVYAELFYTLLALAVGLEKVARQEPS